MTHRVEICGGPELLAAARTLGLIATADRSADLALIDLRDPTALARASHLPSSLPRVVVVDPAQLGVARALGVSESSISTSCEPAALGPLIAGAVPPGRRRATRSVLVTAARGGVGRSLLTANLARRLCATRSVMVLDITGTGCVGWWLGADGLSWSDLEGLTSELGGEHLAVVAAEAAPGLRIAGGPPRAPTVPLAKAALGAALEIAEMVLVDSTALADERSGAAAGLTDRVLVLSYDDPVSLAALSRSEMPESAWLIASQTQGARLGDRDVFRSLPRDEVAIVAAARKRGAVGGALGRAYDELAELLLVDAS